MSTHSTDEQAIHELNREVIDALNRGDAHAFAAFYAPDADYIDSFGRASHGRSNIELTIHALLSGPYKGAKFSSRIDSIRFITPSIVIGDSTTEVTLMQGPPRKIHATTVSVKENGRWMGVAGRSWVLATVAA
jgi:uncharacterized protein (TIGR02246 family)